MVIEKTTGLNQDLLIHQFCHLYTMQIAPRLGGLQKTLSDKFKLEIIPHVEMTYPFTYIELVIEPLFESQKKGIKIEISPDPQNELITIVLKGMNNESVLYPVTEVTAQEWGTTQFETIILMQLYQIFLKNRFKT